MLVSCHDGHAPTNTLRCEKGVWSWSRYFQHFLPWRSLPALPSPLVQRTGMWRPSGSKWTATTIEPGLTRFNWTYRWWRPAARAFLFSSAWRTSPRVAAPNGVDKIPPGSARLCRHRLASAARHSCRRGCVARSPPPPDASPAPGHKRQPRCALW